MVEKMETNMAENSVPQGLTLARVTDVFTHDTVPAGLLRAHKVADGVWGLLVVIDGSLTFVFEDDGDHPISVDAGSSVAIAPLRPHHVELNGPVSFRVEFYR